MLSPAIAGPPPRRESGVAVAARGAISTLLSAPERAGCVLSFGASKVSNVATLAAVKRAQLDRSLMSYLISGGSGFIGSHLAEELLERGHRVHVLDDLSTGAIDNIRHLKAQPGFGYTIESASNVPVLAELVDDADVVYHLAAA